MFAFKTLMPTRILDAISTRPWAITQDALQTILAIAARENPSPEAVAAQLGKPLKNTRAVVVRDGTAVVPIVGPIFRRANLFTDISGATSIEVLAQDFTHALNDPDVKAIVLDIDSPGGEVNGVSELSEMIYAARGIKPITAYVGGLGASAAYWIASAADRVVIDSTAMVGSIGVIAALPFGSDAPTADIEFTSSQSPNKRPSTGTSAGRQQIQDLIDATAEVFVSAVARNRSVTTERVLADFGQGGLFVGQQAVAAGMVDAVGSLEGLLTAESGSTGTARIGRQRATETVISMVAASGGARSDTSSQQENSMDLETTQQQDAAPPVEDRTPPALSPVTVPVPLVNDAVMQAQLNTYAAQMQSQLQEQFQGQYKTMMEQVAEQAKLQHEHWKAQIQTQQAINTFVQHVTTPTLQRQHALPLDGDRLTTFLSGLNGPARQEAQAILSQVLDAGLVSFEELGSSGEGEDARSVDDAWNEAVQAKVAMGMSRSSAITAVMKEKPELSAKYRSNGKGGR